MMRASNRGSIKIIYNYTAEDGNQYEDGWTIWDNVETEITPTGAEIKQWLEETHDYRDVEITNITRLSS